MKTEYNFVSFPHTHYHYQERMKEEKEEGFTEIYVWGSKYMLVLTNLDDYYGQLGVGFERTSHAIPKVCSFNIMIK